MKKILIYGLTLFLMFIGINGVSAKDTIGYCDYNSVKVYVYSDGSVAAEMTGLNPTI